MSRPGQKWLAHVSLAARKRASDSSFRNAYHIRNTKLYQNVGKIRYTGLLSCGRSVDAIKRENVNVYLQRSTPEKRARRGNETQERSLQKKTECGNFSLLSTSSFEVLLRFNFWILACKHHMLEFSNLWLNCFRRGNDSCESSNCQVNVKHCVEVRKRVRMRSRSFTATRLVSTL